MNMDKPKTVASVGRIVEYVWVVTYQDFDNLGPVITVFNNEVVANDCYDYFKKCHNACGIYKCPIYSIFKVTGIVEMEDKNDKRADI